MFPVLLSLFQLSRQRALNEKTEQVRAKAEKRNKKNYGSIIQNVDFCINHIFQKNLLEIKYFISERKKNNNSKKKSIIFSIHILKLLLIIVIVIQKEISFFREK